MNLEKSSDIELTSEEAVFTAKRNNHTLGKKVQIEVEVSRHFLDFENSFLKCKANFTTGAGAGASTNPWFLACCIKNLRVKTLSGQQIGNEIVEYRSYCQMIKELTSNSDFNESYGVLTEGSNPISIPDNDTTTYGFSHKFVAHILSCKGYYPAHFHQGFIIEFDLVNNISEVTTATTSLPSAITFDDFEYIGNVKTLKPEIENELVDMMNNQQLFVDYTEVLTQLNDLKAQAGKQSFDLVGIDGRLRQVFTYTILDSTRDAITEGYFDTWGLNNLSSYRYKLGADYLNYESIEVGTNNQAEQICELLKALDMFTSDKMPGDSALTPTQLRTNRFVVAYKIAKAQKDIDETISSSIDKDRNNMRVELNYGSSPSGVGQIYTHIVLDKRIQILPGSIVRSVKN